jgi:hypothetical protein
MEQGSSGKPYMSVGLAAVNLIGRIIGRGRRQSRYKASKGYNRLRRRSFVIRPGCLVSPECLAVEDDLTMLQQTKPRSSFSSDDEFPRRWTSTHQWYHRRRKGFYCMRLRIVNVARIVAMIRKVRLTYRRMMNAAVASKTMLSLADLYNDISDLIPAPCGNNGARDIVLIRPIKCESADAPAQLEELPNGRSSHCCPTRPPATNSSYVSCERDAHHFAMSAGGYEEKVMDHNPSSKWRKFAFRSFSCICAPSMTSWTSLQD